MKGEFNFKRGNSLSSGYSVKLEVRAFDWSPLMADGVLYHRQETSKARINWNYGSKTYLLEVQHAPIGNGLQYGVQATLQMDTVNS